MNEFITDKFARNLFYIAAIAAFVAIFPIETYGYYIFLRYLLFAAFIVVLVKADATLGDTGFLMLVSIFGAILFNPFMIIEHDKSTWVIFDLIAAGILGYCGNKTDEEIKKDEDHEKAVNDMINRLNTMKNSSGTLKQKYQKARAMIESSDLYFSDKNRLLDQAREIFNAKE